MPQRTAEEAIKVVADAQEQVIQDGDLAREEARWDAKEIAQSVAAPTVIVKTLKQSRSERFRPRGGWRER